MPLNNQYQSPETLGLDRLAGAAGIWYRYPGAGGLVIDMGSCITYDYVDAKGNYLGGAISPGVAMRFKAMHTFTAALPLVEGNEESEILGDTTVRSMRSGVINGVCAEIEGMIGRYRDRYGAFKAVLCGGDAKFFASKVKPTIFADQYLILYGLYRILEENL